MEKVELRASKTKLIPLSLGLILLTILPVYFVYFTDYFSDNPTAKFTCIPISLYLGYNTYGLVKRLLIGPIITLTADNIEFRDNKGANTYRWTDIQSIKVERVDNTSFGKVYQQSLATIWTKSKNSSDIFNISDLNENADELRTLINKYREGTAANNVFI